MWLLSVLLYFALGYSGEAKEESKIIGGSPVSITEVPYQISFRFRDQHFCGGSIVNDEFVVTAAHCVAEFRSVNGLTIVAGQTKLNEGTGQTIAVTEMTPHPRYSSETVDYDVAVLKLAQKLVFNKNVTSIKLATSAVRSGSTAFVTGWGTTRRGGGGDISNQLLGVDVRVQSWLSCQLQYLGQLTNRMFCAGNVFGGFDSCQGDSGGPVKFDDRLVGIVSFGRGCGDIASPGVYTQVYSVLEFIQSATKK